MNGAMALWKPGTGVFKGRVVRRPGPDRTCSPRALCCTGDGENSL